MAYLYNEMSGLENDIMKSVGKYIEQEEKYKPEWGYPDSER